MELNQDKELSSVFEQAFDSGGKQQDGAGLSKEQINAKITDEMNRESGHESMEVEEDQEKVVKNLPPAQKEEIVNSKTEGNVFNAGDARFNALMDFSSGNKSVSIVPSDNCYTYKATFLFNKGWNDTEYFSDLYAHMKNSMEKLAPSENLFDFAGKMVDAIDSEIEFVKEKNNEINVISSEQYAKSQFNYKSDTPKFDENMESYTKSLKDIRQQVSGFYYSGSMILKFIFVTLPSIVKKIVSLFSGKGGEQARNDDEEDDIGLAAPAKESSSSEDLSAVLSSAGEPVSCIDRDRLTGRLFDYASIGEAKLCALEGGRPLLVVVGMMPACAECDIFEDRILKEGSEFRDFARDNGIVVCNVRESTNNLLAKVKKAYKFLVPLSTTPYVFLFKVKESATFGSKVSSALDPSEVELLKKDAAYCGGSYTSKGDWAGLGISNGVNSAWNAKTFTSQVKACFPNNGWEAL